MTDLMTRRLADEATIFRRDLASRDQAIIPEISSQPDQGYSVPVSALCSIWANSRAPPVAAPTAPAARKPREERQDSTDHRDCAENNDPVLSHDPVEISDREEPIEPTDRALPIEPTDKAEPTDPTDSTDPTEPIDNTESCDHNDSTEPEEARRTDGTDSFVMRPCCPLVAQSQEVVDGSRGSRVRTFRHLARCVAGQIPLGAQIGPDYDYARPQAATSEDNAASTKSGGGK